MGTLDQKVTKNSIDIESIKTDIKTIVEVQKAYIDKNERDHEGIIELIDQDIGLHSEEAKGKVPLPPYLLSTLNFPALCKASVK